jgi:uncharacterized membrane protein
MLYACSKLPPEHQLVTAKDGEIRISVNQVNDNKVHFYTYKKSGKSINFFIRTDGTGKLSTYFDTCFTCYKNKKGYRAEGSIIICNECKMKFRLADEKFDNSQGCSPITLFSRIDEENIIIKTVDIEKGGKLF